MSLRIDYLWCATKSDFTWYTKSTGYSVTINYNDIIVNLIKSDIMNAEPPTAVVNLYIRKKLMKVIEDHKNELCSDMAYLIKDLEEDAIDGIFSLVEELANLENVNYTKNLVVINQTQLPTTNILTRFDNVKFVNK
jgi:hypothetical protein